MNQKQGVVNIHGKQYKTVALRVSEFREDFPDLSIQTDIISNADSVVMKAIIVDGNDNIRAVGHAEEVRGSSKINKTSTLENCETSAIGRALACFGLAGEEYASANEVSQAIIQQEVMQAQESTMNLLKAVNKNWNLISEYKKANNVDDCISAWFGISREDRHVILSFPPSKGGVLTTKERDMIINNEEFRAMYAKTSTDRAE